MAEVDEMSLTLSNVPFETSVTLGIYDGADVLLDCDYVSDLLQISPSTVKRKGLPSSRKRISSSNSWLLSSKGFVKSDDISQHLDWLLDAIAGNHSSFRLLKESGLNLDLWLTIKICHWNTLCVISPEQIRRLASYDFQLCIDVYDYQD
jgi:hypothetical protein